MAWSQTTKTTSWPPFLITVDTRKWKALQLLVQKEKPLVSRVSVE